jgi:pyruvate carboxylase
LPLFGQIKVYKAGDGWDLKVDSALTLIKTTDSAKYALLDSVCSNVSFWLSDFSSCESEEGGRIYISVRDVKLNSINNLASVLVHESFHLYIWKRKFILSPKEEENYCYRYELELVNKLPSLEPWLKAHVIEQIKNTQN